MSNRGSASSVNDEDLNEGVILRKSNSKQFRKSADNTIDDDIKDEYGNKGC